MMRPVNSGLPAASAAPTIRGPFEIRKTKTQGSVLSIGRDLGGAQRGLPQPVSGERQNAVYWVREYRSSPQSDTSPQEQLIGMKKEIVTSDKAPAALGPYSVAVKAGQFVFTAGQLGLDPDTGEFAPGGIERQTRQALENLKNVLEAGSSALDKVVKTTVFLQDMNDFAAMNRVYGEFFTADFPARSCVQAARLPKNGLVEIEAVALLD